MKNPTINLLYFLISIFLFSACAKKGEKILKNQKTKDELMLTISRDSLMSSEMLNHILLNELTMQKILKNKHLMESLFTKDNLKELMKEDSVIANIMMCEVLDFAVMDSSLCRNMSQMMMTKKLFEKMGIDKIVEYPLVGKDKLQVNKIVKIPNQKTEAN